MKKEEKRSTGVSPINNWRLFFLCDSLVTVANCTEITAEHLAPSRFSRVLLISIILYNG